MPTINRLKKILGQAEKPKVRVEVSGKAEEMTDTQSIRFDELIKRRDEEKPVADKNPLEDSTYGLTDASLRLMITEDQLLEKAGAGSIHLYIDAGGLLGYWQHSDRVDTGLQSPLEELYSGRLALEPISCQELAVAESARVATLVYRSAPNSSTLNLHPNTLTTLVESGCGSQRYCLQEPLHVSRADILLIPPLVLAK